MFLFEDPRCDSYDLKLLTELFYLCVYTLYFFSAKSMWK